jgi:hypothetical protein
VETRELKLDRNAIGGVLGEVFGVEMTVATSVCGWWGAVGQVAELDVYVHAPGTVVRCPRCGQVLMRIVLGRGRVWLDLQGVRRLELADPATA